MTNRTMKTVAVRVFAALLLASATVLTAAGTATAAPTPAANGIEATYCDGWTIASAAYIRDRFNSNKVHGAVQLLRNYCHAAGDDYVMWLGRGFAYNTLPRGDYVNVQLHDKYGQVQICNLQGGNAPNAFCTTAAQYSDITGINQHMANAAIWDCGPTCGGWYAFGQTVWK